MLEMTRIREISLIFLGLVKEIHDIYSRLVLCLYQINAYFFVLFQLVYLYVVNTH